MESLTVDSANIEQMNGPQLYRCGYDLDLSISLYLEETNNPEIKADTAVYFQCDLDGGDSIDLKDQSPQFAYPPGDGFSWKPLVPSAELEPTSSREASSGPERLPKKSRTPGKNHKGKRRGRESSARHNKKGVHIQAAGGDEKLSSARRLLKKWIDKGSLLQTTSYSIVEDSAHTLPGWNGTAPKKSQRNEIKKAFFDGSIKDTLKYFLPIPYHDNKPLILLDSCNRVFLYRTTQASWIESQQIGFADAALKLIGPSLQSSLFQSEDNSAGDRGDHFACIIGHHRPYHGTPMLTKWHQKNSDLVEEFISTPVIAQITWVNAMVELVFPGVAQRYRACAEWHRTEYNIHPLFGLFWNFCINGIYPNQKRIHCKPHADSKNIVGVCVLVIYQLPGYNFNHSKRTWLVIWEAGVVVQLPPWVMICYPSSLFYHFNIDIHDIKFVTTNGYERPTPENSVEIGNGDDEGRGSLVYFNQAAMFQSSETNSTSLTEAKEFGHDGRTDFARDAQTAFQNLGAYVSDPNSSKSMLM